MTSVPTREWTLDPRIFNRESSVATQPLVFILPEDFDIIVNLAEQPFVAVVIPPRVRSGLYETVDGVKVLAWRPDTLHDSADYLLRLPGELLPDYKPVLRALRTVLRWEYGHRHTVEDADVEQLLSYPSASVRAYGEAVAELSRITTSLPSGQLRRPTEEYKNEGYHQE